MPDSLKGKIVRHIASNGPIRIDEFMQFALYDPSRGYYINAMPIGRQGDFTTAPEVSQLFGEALAIFVIRAFHRLGKPKVMRIIELGPGRGTLMNDILRVLQRFEAVYESLKIEMVEKNSALRTAAVNLLDKALKGRKKISWHEDIDNVTSGEEPTLIIANEFLDCLPVRQFVRSEVGWHEKMVGLSGTSLRFGLDSSICADPPNSDLDDKVGTVREFTPKLEETIAQIKRILGENGTALLIDYGYAKNETGDTLQAISRHQKISPLDKIGHADITAHVDFLAVANYAVNCNLKVEEITTQRNFIISMGMETRLDALIRANPEKAQKMVDEFERLVSRQQMGELFKAIILKTQNYND